MDNIIATIGKILGGVCIVCLALFVFHLVYKIVVNIFTKDEDKL
jgi:hypothetical protein